MHRTLCLIQTRKSRILSPTSTAFNLTAENPKTEERKHAVLFAATILCARKLIDIIDSDKPNFAKGFFVDKAIEEVAFVLERIDKKWPQTSETARLKTQSA